LLVVVRISLWVCGFVGGCEDFLVGMWVCWWV